MAVTERRRNGKRFYQAEVYTMGVRVASKSCQTVSEAHAWHDATARRYKSGLGPVGEMTVGEAIDSFLASELASLVDTTRRHIRTYLRLVIESPIASTRMSDVAVGTIDRLLKHLLASDAVKNPNRHTFKRELKQLAAVFNYYRETFDYTFASPILRRHFKRAQFRKVGERRPDWFIPVADARTWLAMLAKGQDPVYHDVALFQLVTGCRIGEVAALCWNAVEKHQIRIKRTMVWKDEFGHCTARPEDRTKTKTSNRTIPLPAVLKTILAAAKKRHPKSSVVFVNRFGRLLNDNAIRANYNRAFEAAGLPWRATHILRHTNATLAIKELRAEAVQVNHGHATNKETLGYAKVHHVVNNSVPETVAAMLKGDHVQNHVHYPQAPNTLN